MSFIPMTVYSFRRYRLPKKQKEYEDIMAKLHAQDREGAFTVPVLDNDYSARDYFLPVAFVSLFTFFGFYVLLRDNPPLLLAGVDLLVPGTPNLYVKRSLVAIGMAFLGSYVWAVQYIFRRLVTIDLPPGAYYSIGTRMVLSTFVALVFHHFLSGLSGKEADMLTMNLGAGQMSKNMLPVIAFLAGIFPQRALQYMVDRFKFTAVAQGKRADDLPLEMLEGMDAFHKMRLSELGIDNVQNLAQASLVELILRTPFRPSQLIDWIAQAKLCLIFKTEVQKLRKAGVRSVLDLKLLGDGGKLAETAKSAGVEESHLQTVYHTIKDNGAIKQLFKAEGCLLTV